MSNQIIIYSYIAFYKTIHKHSANVAFKILFQSKNELSLFFEDDLSIQTFIVITKNVAYKTQPHASPRDK